MAHNAVCHSPENEPMRWEQAWKGRGRGIGTTRVAPIGLLLLLLLLLLQSLASAEAIALDSPAILVKRGVVYDPRYGLRMDLYERANGGPFPAVLLLHPGGFVFGDRSSMAPLAGFLARHGFAAFPLDYRLAPRSPFPAAVLDSQRAVRFVRVHAARFGVDPARIGVFGASAGGNLAAMVGWRGTGPWDVGARVAAVVSWSGPLDLGLTLRGDPALTPDFAAYLGGSFSVSAARPNPARLGAASPVGYLDRSDPPSFVANSRAESIPLEVAKEAAAKLRG